MELKPNVEPITFNEKSEILETDYIINQIIIG